MGIVLAMTAVAYCSFLIVDLAWHSSWLTNGAWWVGIANGAFFTYILYRHFFRKSLSATALIAVVSTLIFEMLFDIANIDIDLQELAPVFFNGSVCGLSSVVAAVLWKHRREASIYIQ